MRKLVITLVVVGILVALFLAFSTQDFIYDMVSYAWAGLGASFGPAIVLSLHWKRTSGAGVVAGMLTGSITTVLWSEISIGGTPLNDYMTVRFVSFLLAALAVWGVSLMSRTRPEGSWSDTATT